MSPQTSSQAGSNHYIPLYTEAASREAASVLRSMHMITKRTKLLLALLVVVALSAHAYLYWWSTTEDHGVLDAIPVVQSVSETVSSIVRPKPQAPANEAPVVSEDGTPEVQVVYRTYENGEFGFSFSYPETWQLSLTTNVDGTTVCVMPPEGTGACRLTIRRVAESVNASMEKTLAALAADYRAGRITTGSRRIAGEAAAIIAVGGYPAGEERATRAAVFVHDRQIYTIEAAAGQEAIFEKAASSFSFQN